MANIQRIKTITEFHRSRGLAAPEHPLISVINYADVRLTGEQLNQSWMLDFYLISLKRNIGGNIRYGQQAYDFDEGVMFFIAPGQIFSIKREADVSGEKSGWMLLIHPDFIWNSSLGKKIKSYEYFDYTIHEALFVSKREEQLLERIIEDIRQEYQTNIDKYSQNIILSQIDTLLNYSERFYNRQFLTRKKAGHKLLEKMEHLLTTYFNEKDLVKTGLPTVGLLADQLNVSAKYLSSLLRILTGLSAQQHIHEKLIGKAKEKLSATSLSVSEIAYELGFEHPQSFSKLFKQKTDVSPLEFRRSFHIN
ncbi:AraC family transcriptional regulator [Pedobacter lusitanus]|uniref:AraC family transcriptional regulator n=1 Tax=Pedobacter lusitanus TaxID=1503925 RepID=A0A0D0GEL1_9SPHI|nr:response regulator transcription factor [Pedobacter lusitanus]KIO75737.1 AraC family transcriptional regulator [Pedobacter lusitanus]